MSSTFQLQSIPVSNTTTTTMDKKSAVQVHEAAIPLAATKTTDFDPCSNAKPCSPFYLYNHDSPRPSTDQRPKASFNTSTHDLESGSEMLTPSVTQEKLDNTTTKMSICTTTGWRSRVLSKQCSQMTKPKQKSWLQRMPTKKRRWVKAMIALFIIACMIGIAVGIAAGLKSGVWKSNNSTSNIHT